MIGEQIADFFSYDFKVLKDYIDNWKPVEELVWISQNKDRRFIKEISDSEREYFDRGWHELKKLKPELEITYQDFVDNKIKVDGKSRKLFKYLNDKELSEFIGKYKLPKAKLYLVISTNFDDFLMCSTKNPWTCCTDLRNGDFRFTTIGNLFFNGRFIAYITNLEKTEYKGLESFKMFFRCFGFVNKYSKLVANIWYPIKSYMSFKNEYFEPIANVINTEPKYGFNKVFNKHDMFFIPYLDYSVIKNDEIVFYSDYIHYKPIIEFRNSKRERYSSVIKFSEEEKNIDELFWSFCEVCGKKGGFIETYGDVNYCEDCFKKAHKNCSFCGNEYLLQNLNFTEDNKWICKDCIPENYKSDTVLLCNCKTIIRKRGETFCRFCRSDKTDAFKNIDFNYIDKGNLKTYFKHHYVEDDKLPPGIKCDEEVFEMTECYVKR